MAFAHSMAKMISQASDERQDVHPENFAERMERFNQVMELHSNNRKADLLAYAEMRAAGDVARTQVGKRPDGVQPATAFELRAELAVTGVHKELMRDISVDSQSGVAESIVFSGYYAANEDSGDSFVYSGEGGLQNGVQVADQEWTKGNLGLRQACESKTPIRVVRCIMNDSKKKTYFYEGLYQITNCWTETRNGFDICLFKGQGLEEEYSVSGKVGYKPNVFYKSNGQTKWRRRKTRREYTSKEKRKKSKISN